MRVLTIHDPWATAIARGAKPIENRKRPPPSTVEVPFEMAIHASVKKPTERLMLQVMGLWPQLKWGTTFHPGHVIAVVDVIGWHPHSDNLPPDGWATGPCCWRLDSVCALAEPVRCRGRQGLQHLPPDVEAEVRRQLEAA